MSTIDDKNLIDKIIKNHGYYMDDERVYMIVEYMNAWGNKTWGVTWVNEPPARRTRYLEDSDFVQHPKVIWHCNGDKS